MFNLKNLESMKKSFLMLGAAIIALTSCTQSEVLNVAQQPEKPIGFEPFVDRQTRVTNDITDESSTFKELYVFGAKGTLGEKHNFTVDSDNAGTTETPFYLDHVQVTGGKGNWSYDPHKAWIANKSFRFAAYANGKGDGTGNAAKLQNVTFVPNEAVTTTTTGDDGTSTTDTTDHVWGLNITGYTVGANDLIAAVPETKTVTEITTAPASVGLTFKHLLAKVIVQFRYTNNANNTDLKLEVDPITFKAYNTGDCKVRYTGVADNTTIGATWTTTGSADATYNLFTAAEFDWDSYTWNNGNIESSVYVIPQSNTGITIPLITINTKNENGEITSTTKYQNVALAISGYTDWKPGYVYRYIADITPGEHYIHFTTSVTSWIDEDNRNQTINGGSTTGE